MNGISDLVQPDAVTQWWLAAVVCCAGLYGYADNRIRFVHEEEKRTGPDQTGRHNRLHALFLVVCGGWVLSFVGLAYQSPLLCLLVVVGLAGLSWSGLSRRVGSGIYALAQRVSRWRWSTGTRSARFGLLGAGGLSTLSIVEPECLLSYLSLTTGSSDQFLALIASRLDEVSLWADGLTVVAVFIVGSALWQTSARMRQENELLFPAIERVYSWRTDSRLLAYLTLLVLLMGLIALISLTFLSTYTFWIGYGSVFLGQLTPMGQRIGEWLGQTVESFFRPAGR